MNEDYIMGESAMDNFTGWWKDKLPSYLLMCCTRGEAQILVQFERYHVRQGSMAFISPDMFPSFVSRSADFHIVYCLMSREFAENSLYGIPNALYDCLFLRPVVEGGQEMDRWMGLLCHTYRTYAGFSHQGKMMENLLHNIYLVFFNLWQQQYGSKRIEREQKRPEQLCMKFYNLVFDHFQEQRDTKFYADRLCITPNYLAMIVRQVCKESPKDAINRQVVSELKYMVKHTAMTAEEMAVRLHFPDTSYMCRYFKKHTGMAISEYRKSSKI